MLNSMSFTGYSRRRVYSPEQGLVREPLRLLLLRPEDDSQDKILRGRPQTSLQKVLRQASPFYQPRSGMVLQGSLGRGWDI